MDKYELQRMLAYAAGIIDGEGSIQLTRMRKGDKFRVPIVTVANTELSILHYMQFAFGGNILNKKTYQEHHLPSYTWGLYYRPAVIFLELVEPYLIHPEKIRRARWIVQKYRDVTIRNGRYNEEQLKAKVSFEEEFIHPTDPIYSQD